MHPDATASIVSDSDVLADVGIKDITAHVDFTGVVFVGQDAGFDGRRLHRAGRASSLNCGIGELMERGRAPVPRRRCQRVRDGELFKVIVFIKAWLTTHRWPASGD